MQLQEVHIFVYFRARCAIVVVSSDEFENNLYALTIKVCDPDFYIEYNLSYRNLHFHRFFPRISLNLPLTLSSFSLFLRV